MSKEVDGVGCDLLLDSKRREFDLRERELIRLHAMTRNRIDVGMVEGVRGRCLIVVERV